MRFLFAFLLSISSAFASVPLNQASIVIVQGAGGEDAFEKEFNAWTLTLEATLSKAGLPVTIIGRDAGTNDLDKLENFLSNAPKNGQELCLIFFGHGTFDGREAKFNMRGPDLSATALAAMLDGFERPIAIVNAFSASAPFLQKLSRTNRVIITATRSGYEQNFARFGKFFSESFGNPIGDLDKDGEASLLETYLAAARKTASFYESEGRLATEHPLLDDNGDTLGTPADFFKGVRLVKKASSKKDGAAEVGKEDGKLAHQFHLLPLKQEFALTPDAKAARAQLENKIEQLRAKKEQIEEQDYYSQLEKLLLELATVYGLDK